MADGQANGDTGGDQKTTASRPVDPIPATVIGVGDASRLPSGTVAVTPGIHAPDVVTTVIGPVRAIAVRFINQFLTTLLGLVGAGMTPAGASILHARDFAHLILACASLSVAGAGFGLIKDLVTIFGRLEQKYPLLTGSV